MMSKYAIGIDFGTESGRAVLVSLENGEEIAEHVTVYPHGVIDEKLPYSNKELGFEWALQHPGDYIEVLKQSIPGVINNSGVNPEDIIGVGIDFTSCTMLPIDSNAQPLCFDSKWKDNPHSWVKLWKHHAAQDEANKINEVATERGEKFISRYGGKISSEWMFAKILQILNDAPEVYEATDQFIEAGDWVVSQLTGEIKRNSCSAGYKAMWHKQEGYPSNSYFKALDPRLENVVETKLRGEIYPIGTKAGELTKEMAEMTGLKEGTSVAVGVIDAHAGVPGVGAVKPGQMVMAMGTSLCHMLISDVEVEVEGISGVVEDGIIPGLFGYEAGQAAVGDIFAWFVENAVPEEVVTAAKQAGKNVHQLLEEKASSYKPGESGLLALDWWNGNRSVLVDADLSGLLIGATLQTKPEEIYRALLESTAYGTRKVIETFENHGVKVEELYACGGLSQKNNLLMQIFADVTNRPIKIAASKQTTALGAAMFGAVAAGEENGGYNTVVEAAQKMAKVKEEVVTPIPENVAIYDKLYKEYSILHDYFGRGTNDVMKRLKSIRYEVSN